MGEWGFAAVSASTAGSSVVVLNSTGEQIRAIDAVVLTSGDGRMVVIPATSLPNTADTSVERATEPTGLTIVDHALSTVAGPVEQLDLPSRPDWAAMDHEGDRIALGEIAAESRTSPAVGDLPLELAQWRRGHDYLSRGWTDLNAGWSAL